MRLDQLLVHRGFFESRSRARDAIGRGTVRIAGQVVAKPGQAVAADAPIEVDDPAQGYVSRAALKLIHGLDRFGFDPAGKVALDIGASTGGFTQVLLERGAAQVFALDVGHGQLSETLRRDPRVTAMEGFNARALQQCDLKAAPEFIVCDVSFISLKLALPPALGLAAPKARAIVLVKPQFEAGPGRIGKNGLVDPEIASAIAHDMRDWLASLPGWNCTGLIDSPISGGDGNMEFLLAAMRSDG